MTIVSVCLSPGFQRSVVVDSLALGEVNRLKSVDVDVSGKGVNVTRVLQRLGVAACCLSQGGSNADELVALAREEGLDLRLIPSSGRVRTCTTIIEIGHRVTELVEPTPAVDAPCVDAMSEALRAMLPSATALVISGSMAPGFPAGYQAQLAALAHAAGVPVFIDLQGAPLREALVAEPAVVKINLAEFVATFLADRFQGGEQSGPLAEVEIPEVVMAAVAEVSRRYATSFVLTRGAKSILLLRSGESRVFAVPALAAQEIVSPIGSGDAFMAGLLAQLLKTGDLSSDRLRNLDVLAEAVGFATACAQSNARTARPGFLEDNFVD